MSHENTYDIGDVARLTASFSQGGGAVDPGAVAFKVLEPGGAVASVTPVVKDAVGEYHADYVIAAAGVHVYRGEGTGANAAAAENRFQVRRSLILEAEAP